MLSFYDQDNNNGPHIKVPETQRTDLSLLSSHTESCWSAACELISVGQQLKLKRLKTIMNFECTQASASSKGGQFIVYVSELMLKVTSLHQQNMQHALVRSTHDIVLMIYCHCVIMPIIYQFKAIQI